MSRHGRRHSKGRDAAAISHHYDVGNDFYALVLGPSMVYSCAVWESEQTGLDAAQAAKLDLVCRKLGLEPGMRVLDVGCGWGSFALHAAQHYGVDVVGVTLSVEQAALARKRAADAGLTDRVDIRVQDYRDVDDGPFDAISSIGMSEHVGREQIRHYASHAAGAAPAGRPAAQPRDFLERRTRPRRTRTPSFPATSSRTARCSASRTWSRRSNRRAWRSWTSRRCGATMP